MCLSRLADGCEIETVIIPHFKNGVNTRNTVCVSSQVKTTLETSGEDVKTTLETSEKDANNTRNEWKRCIITLVSSVVFRSAAVWVVLFAPQVH
jgi:hypothetical protein